MNKSANNVICLGGIFSLINLGFFLLMRPVWIFVDNTVMLPKDIPISFTELFAGVMILFSLFFILISVIRTYTDKIIRTTLLKVIIFIIILLEFIFLGLNIYLYMQLGNSKSEVLRQLIQSMPYIGAVLLFLYLTLIYPKTKLSQSKLVRLIIILFVIIVSLLMIFNLRQVRISSGPILQSVDSNTIAVIWSTNVNSTGEVQYGPDADHMITAFEMEDGLIKANTKLHKVLITTTDRNELVYQVLSTKINNWYQCNVTFGNTVKSPVISYQNINNNEDLSFYILNDVHSNIQIYKDFLSDKEYDFIVTNGDALEVTESYDVVIKELLLPIGKYTNNNKLFYFVRGNHETRGEEARNLKDYLALPEDRYYYTFSIGPVYAIVLDSGEDKLDDHMEYSGLVDFESYKKEETKWLEEVLKSDEYKASKYQVVFVHSPLNNYIEQPASNYLSTYESMWRTMLSDAGIDVAFSGHAHTSQLLKPDEYDATFSTVIAGGDAWNEKDYLALRTEITAQQMIIYYENIDGFKEEVLRIIPEN